LRGALVAAALGGSLALSLTLSSAIEGWNGGHFG
jgi:hypothetical protein